MLNKIAFAAGVAVGLFNVVAAATTVLTYYFTGRLPSLVMTPNATGARRPRLALLTADEVIEQTREQTRRRLARR